MILDISDSFLLLLLFIYLWLLLLLFFSSCFWGKIWWEDMKILTLPKNKLVFIENYVQISWMNEKKTVHVQNQTRKKRSERSKIMSMTISEQETIWNLKTCLGHWRSTMQSRQQQKLVLRRCNTSHILARCARRRWTKEERRLNLKTKKLLMLKKGVTKVAGAIVLSSHFTINVCKCK